ncbi:hypothetical protein KR018_012176 [Drosophila ironensis]|nr:hypothetical protein KR018_012176 [Drosophila ironensis]
MKWISSALFLVFLGAVLVKDSQAATGTTTTTTTAATTTADTTTAASTTATTTAASTASTATTAASTATTAASTKKHKEHKTTWKRVVHPGRKIKRRFGNRRDRSGRTGRRRLSDDYY